ncbi:PAS domain S-box protein [Halorussus gelatinilyticus]|uniref:histidine kinase n=1 Tax=Halorussus gelatinilyticus TaxID=2937524 RepID=A0A8U0IHY4_9EURY|nr:PAS domain S-box protein [Halorussus gelatinilyticus]UPW00281.1 PAS domain S-box protein [Halorussus gelatinilyticus]
MDSSGITLAETLTVLETTGASGAPVTASEVAEALGCERQTARDRLDELTERGDAETKEVGGSVRVWWTTDRQRRDRDLERYEAVFRTVNDGIYVKDEENRFTLVNETYAEMLGYTPDELVGRDSSFLVSEEVLNAAEELYSDLRTGDHQSETIEASLETADGETVETEASFALIPLDEERGEYERVGVVRDVTERKERERRLERQNKRLESFASMLAHELRNPVTIGQIYGQRLPSDEAPEAVEYVTDAFDRIEDMIDVLLVLARGGDAVGESEPVALADVAREAWEQVNAPDATLTVATDRVLLADETYVRHLFENLLENAVEHGSTSPRPADENAVERGSEGAAADEDAGLTVTVGDVPTGFYVADDGVGIPPEDRETVFEVGYTTAESEGGIGVGLTFVAELVETYEWECAVTESEAGGARFEFTNVTLHSEE